MEPINFTKEEREIIAEFVFSFSTDILIKNDAIKLVDVLSKHNIIDNPQSWKEEINNQADGISGRLLGILSTKIPNDQGTNIMNEYYGK